MPKKNRSKPSKPQSTAHPALANRSNVQNSAADGPSSVNDLLHNLRRSTAHGSLPSPAAIAASLVPPPASHLLVPFTPAPPGRSVLDRTKAEEDAAAAASAAAEPRIAVYAPRQRRMAARRPPGPAPPRSWLERRAGGSGSGNGSGLGGSMHAPMGRATGGGRGMRYFTAGAGPGKAPPLQPLDAASEIGVPIPVLPGVVMPGKKSLKAMVMRVMAKNWAWHREVDGKWLGCLPGGVKATLLAFLARYGAPVDRADLVMLLAGYEGDGEEEKLIASDVNALIVGRFLSDERGAGLSYKDLEALLTVSQSQGYKVERAWAEKNRKRKEANQEVPDSWEDEADEEVGMTVDASSLSLVGTLRSFDLLPNLTRLSLANCPNPSWRSLLHISRYVYHFLTHLSLAGWPFPTITPRATASGALVDGGGPISPRYSGTGFFVGKNIYRPEENEYAEGISIFKRLGVALPNIEWLDLQGCDDWLEKFLYSTLYEDENSEQNRMQATGYNSASHELLPRQNFNGTVLPAPDGVYANDSSLNPFRPGDDDPTPPRRRSFWLNSFRALKVMVVSWPRPIPEIATRRSPLAFEAMVARRRRFHRRVGRSKDILTRWSLASVCSAFEEPDVEIARMVENGHEPGLHYVRKRQLLRKESERQQKLRQLQHPSEQNVSQPYVPPSLRQPQPDADAPVRFNLPPFRRNSDVGEADSLNKPALPPATSETERRRRRELLGVAEDMDDADQQAQAVTQCYMRAIRGAMHWSRRHLAIQDSIRREARWSIAIKEQYGGNAPDSGMLPNHSHFAFDMRYTVRRAGKSGRWEEDRLANELKKEIFDPDFDFEEEDEGTDTNQSVMADEAIYKRFRYDLNGEVLAPAEHDEESDIMGLRHLDLDPASDFSPLIFTRRVISSRPKHGDLIRALARRYIEVDSILGALLELHDPNFLTDATESEIAKAQAKVARLRAAFPAAAAGVAKLRNWPTAAGGGSDSDGGGGGEGNGGWSWLLGIDGSRGGAVHRVIGLEHSRLPEALEEGSVDWETGLIWEEETDQMRD